MPASDGDYLVDPSRLDEWGVGIYIRARHDGKWGTHDLAHLDRDSVTRWLRRNDGTAERVVLLLLFGPPGRVLELEQALSEERALVDRVDMILALGPDEKPRAV